MNKFNYLPGVVFAGMLMDSVDEDASSVSGFSKPNAEMMREIQKEEEERIMNEKKNAAKNQLSEDQCRQKYEALILKRKRAEEKAFADRLKARTEENNKYLAGDLDITEHQENLEKINNEYDEKISKIEREHRKMLDNLRTANPKIYNRVVNGW